MMVVIFQYQERTLFWFSKNFLINNIAPCEKFVDMPFELPEIVSFPFTGTGEHDIMARR